MMSPSPKDSRHSPSRRPAIVYDSHGDSDSDYDYEHDLARFRSRQVVFAQELQRHSLTMSSRTRAVASPASSLSSLSDKTSDDSDEDLAAFFDPASKSKKPGLRASTPDPPKLSLAEILALNRKNKARDYEISRAKRLLDGGTADKPVPSTTKDPPDGPSELKDDRKSPLPDTLKPEQLKSSQPVRQWSFFGSASDLSQSSYKQLRDAWRESLARSHIDLPTDSRDSMSCVRPQSYPWSPLGIADIMTSPSLFCVLSNSQPITWFAIF
ncbi:hypothetical protein ABW21_db0203775 [Orbilia brochopaga]|nr:hypothetical protein ABW21_db0203775 [Drechslerella brochopaga]